MDGGCYSEARAQLDTMRILAVSKALHATSLLHQGCPRMAMMRGAPYMQAQLQQLGVVLIYPRHTAQRQAARPNCTIASTLSPAMYL